MIRGMDATLKWFATAPSLEIVDVVQSFFPDVPRDLFAACIDRYRALELWGRDPVIRRAGYDRLHAAMRSSGILSRDIAFEDVVDTRLATRAIG
jgi:NitT/TauT family transport system substrate-binding protein